MKEIHAGKATVLTSRQWRDRLRLSKAAPKLTRNINKASATYISRGDLACNSYTQTGDQ